MNRQSIRTHGLARLCAANPEALTPRWCPVEIMIETNHAHHFGLCHIVGLCQVGNRMIRDITEFFLQPVQCGQQVGLICTRYKSSAATRKTTFVVVL